LHLKRKTPNRSSVEELTVFPLSRKTRHGKRGQPQTNRDANDVRPAPPGPGRVKVTGKMTFFWGEVNVAI